MKKIGAIALLAFVSTSVFAKTVVVDPAKLKPSSVEREYVSTDTWVQYIGNIDDLQAEFTVIFYLYPALESSRVLKSDPISINCNGNEIMLAPGSSFACTVNPKQNGNGLQYHINSDYARNGADISSIFVAH